MVIVVAVVIVTLVIVKIVATVVVARGRNRNRNSSTNSRCSGNCSNSGNNNVSNSRSSSNSSGSSSSSTSSRTPAKIGASESGVPSRETPRPTSPFPRATVKWLLAIVLGLLPFIRCAWRGRARLSLRVCLCQACRGTSSSLLPLPTRRGLRRWNNPHLTPFLRPSTALTSCAPQPLPQTPSPK